MQELQEIEHSHMRVLTTKQLSSAYDSSDKIVMRNFQRNRERYEIGKHYFALSGEDLKQFKASRQNDVSLKFVSCLYLWTELGAWLHAKSLNTDQAWKAYQLLVETYYSLAQKQALSEGHDNMTPALYDQRFYQIESRLEALEKLREEITLHSGEQRRLQNAIGERVYQLTRKEKGARSVLFRSLYSALYERFEVVSYRDVKRDDLQGALRFVSNWKG